VSWYQLIDIAKQAAAERQFYAAQPPAACPDDGEPLLPGPDGTLFCRFSGFRYPQDWDPATMAGM
jgi:hypothetical protein